MKEGLENGPMDADGDGQVDVDEFIMFYNDISAGIPSVPPPPLGFRVLLPGMCEKGRM